MDVFTITWRFEMVSQMIPISSDDIAGKKLAKWSLSRYQNCLFFDLIFLINQPTTLSWDSFIALIRNDDI